MVRDQREQLSSCRCLARYSNVKGLIYNVHTFKKKNYQEKANECPPTPQTKEKAYCGIR